MPRYYFHVRWPGRKDDDPTGMWLADDAMARDYAERLIGEMKEGEGQRSQSLDGRRKGRHGSFHFKKYFPREIGQRRFFWRAR